MLLGSPTNKRAPKGSPPNKPDPKRRQEKSSHFIESDSDSDEEEDQLNTNNDFDELSSLSGDRARVGSILVEFPLL